jgi:hypothetical protein
VEYLTDWIMGNSHQFNQVKSKKEFKFWGLIFV